MEANIGDTILVKAVVRRIIYDEKGKHYAIVIKGDTLNTNIINPEDIEDKYTEDK